MAIDELFDRRYRIDTGGAIPLDQLSVDGAIPSSESRYQPIRVRHLQRLLAPIPDYQRTTFVDFGAGKGRALIVASLSGFTRAVGVEFAAELCLAAERNALAFEGVTDAPSGIEIVHRDAAQYRIEPDQSVFYLYSPFGEDLLQVVVDNIEASLRAHPRPVWILYSNPKGRRVIDGREAFIEAHQETWGGTRSVAYTAAAV